MDGIYLNVEDVARYRGVEPNTIRGYIARKKAPEPEPGLTGTMWLVETILDYWPEPGARGVPMAVILAEIDPST